MQDFYHQPYYYGVRSPQKNHGLEWFSGPTSIMAVKHGLGSISNLSTLTLIGTARVSGFRA